MSTRSSVPLIMREKTRLRRDVLMRRAAMSRLDIHQKSLAIAARICTMAAFGSSHTIMVYMALPHEVQTATIIANAWRMGKRVVVPVVTEVGLMPVELPHDPARLRTGPYGILEPQPPVSAVRPEDISCIYVPGIAFDQRGGRLGFGKGYYDRFLRQLPVTTGRHGVAFTLQLVSCVPQMPHDVPMHDIVTEQGFIPCEGDNR